MPYNLPQDDSRFENVIEALNLENQTFNVFVGDIKSSKVPCSDAIYYKMFNYFEKFKAPLIYTPGDNEWTDCMQSLTDKKDSNDRLAFLRVVFFKGNTSLGINKIALASESSDTNYKKFVENKQWDYGNITFASIHAIGSNNNFKSDVNDPNIEFNERQDADIFWLNSVFKKAKLDNSLGVVLFLHADMLNPDKGSSGFIKILEELKRLVLDYKKPVLLVHGDSHKFIIDKPFMYEDNKKKTIMNFTRLQVFGEADMHAVKVIINPANKNLFEFQEVWIDKNLN
jgi:hypothetical protein